MSTDLMPLLLGFCLRASLVLALGVGADHRHAPLVGVGPPLSLDVCDRRCRAGAGHRACRAGLASTSACSSNCSRLANRAGSHRDFRCAGHRAPG